MEGGADEEKNALAQSWEHLRALGSLLGDAGGMLYNNTPMLLLRIVGGGVVVWLLWPQGVEFFDYSHQIAESLSQPQVNIQLHV